MPLHPPVDFVATHEVVGLLAVVIVTLVGVLAGVEVPDQFLLFPVLRGGMVGIVDHHQRHAQLAREAHLRLVNLCHQRVQAALLVSVGLHELPGMQLHVEAVAVNVEKRADLLSRTYVVPGFDVPGELGNHAAVAGVDAIGVPAHEVGVE